MLLYFHSEMKTVFTDRSKYKMWFVEFYKNVNFGPRIHFKNFQIFGNLEIDLGINLINKCFRQIINIVGVTLVFFLKKKFDTL